MQDHGLHLFHLPDLQQCLLSVAILDQVFSCHSGFLRDLLGHHATQSEAREILRLRCGSCVTVATLGL